MPIDAAAIEVLATLDLAVDRASHGDRGATEAWIAAHDRFQISLEPVLREQITAEDLLAIEYAFARVRSAIEHGEPAAPELEALTRRLEEATHGPVTIAHR